MQCDLLDLGNKVQCLMKIVIIALYLNFPELKIFLKTISIVIPRHADFTSNGAGPSPVPGNKVVKENSR